MNNPREKAQEYQKNLSYQTHEFIGVIRAVHIQDKKTLYELEVKGRLDIPADCEVVTPDNQFQVTFKKFTTLDGRELATIHPGQKDHVLIELPKEVPVGTILRKKRTAPHQPFLVDRP